MSSLYQISNDIIRILSDIENSEGEVVDEQYDDLCIKEEELKSKLDDYVKAVKSFEADEKALKDEKKRFNDRQNVLKNRIERLKKAALDAVLAFGQKSKNNMFIELPTFRLSSRSFTSIEVDEERIEVFIQEFERYIRELSNADILYTGEDVDLQGVLDCINANVIAEFGDDFEPFTIADLVSFKLNISHTASVYDLFKNGMALNLYGKNPLNTTIENATSKDDWKSAIETYKTDANNHVTIAKSVVSQSLQIK